VTGVYGFYKNQGKNKIKCAHYQKEANPKQLGKRFIQMIINKSKKDLDTLFDTLILVQEDDKLTNIHYNTIKHLLQKSFKKTKKNSKKDYNKNMYPINYNFMRAKHNNIKQYINDLNNNGLRLFLDAKNYLKQSHLIDWVYIYNLDTSQLEIYYKKKNRQEKLTNNRPIYEHINQHFNLIQTLDYKNINESNLDIIYNIIYDKNFNG